jgi:chemotaxis protein methyltransferase CheR
MPLSLTKSEFELLRIHIQNISGINLDDSKMALMESRLSPLLERFQCYDYMSLYQKAKYTDEINGEICCAISTNETSFFRDSNVFEMIRDNFIPHFLNKSNSLSVWSAASSYGQEAYSIAMILHEAIVNIDKYDIKIEGTDISNKAIAYASYGLYTPFEAARGVDAARLNKHFDQTAAGYRIKDKLRYYVHYRELNLLKNIPFGAEFDIILCRNVAIYFNKETKRQLFEKLYKCLKPRGRLIIGSTETLWQVTDIFHRRDYKGVVYYALTKNGD